MRKPAYLSKGDKIYLVAPSFGVTTEPYLTRNEVAVKNWKRKGFLVEEGPNVHLEEGVAGSASPKKRGEEINKAFASDAKLILSVGGGETMDEILPYVDFEAIKKAEPKWFMGFSDNTNLVFPLVTLADTMAIYGSCAPSFYPKKWRLAEKDALAILQGEKHFEGYPKYSITRSNPDHPLYQYRCTQPKIIQNYGLEEAVEGIVLGGCLDCLVNLCGTRFDKVKEFNEAHKEGVLWFLEACDLTPLALRRALFQLREAGWFENAKGIFFGRPRLGHLEFLGVNKVNAVIDILGDLGLPILLDIDLGHIPPSMPLLMGAKAKVYVKDGNINIDYLE